jgi:Rieske 2Fe-2S family protein
MDQSTSTPIKTQFERTMLPRAQAHQMPGQVYTSKEIFAAEKDRIFMKTWLCVGREEQIAKPGDYMTGEIMREPYIVARSKEGEINAFLNMCLHRGVPVAEGHGNVRGFSCPYHAWFYSLEGKLITAPYMDQSEVSLKNCRLKPIKLALWRGWIFVSFNPDVEPFDQFIGPLEKDLWWFKSEDSKFAAKETLDIDCNWKLLLENLIDIYHVPVLHKGSFGSFLKSDKNAIDFQLLANGGWQYEQEARPHSKGGRQMFPTLPWLEGRGIGTSMKGGIFPNLNLSLRFDSLRLWVILPITEGKSQLLVYSLFAPSAFEQNDFWQNYEEYKNFLLPAIVDEDGPMVVRLQQAMASRFYEPGPLSHMEGAVHHLMRHYLETMGDSVGAAER